MRKVIRKRAPSAIGQYAEYQPYLPAAFKPRLEALINTCSRENDSNTPDFILAQYIMSCLEAYELATRARDRWYGVHLEPGNKRFKKEQDR